MLNQKTYGSYLACSGVLLGLSFPLITRRIHRLTDWHFSMKFITLRIFAGKALGQLKIDNIASLKIFESVETFFLNESKIVRF